MSGNFNFNERCEMLIAEYSRRDGQKVAQRLEEIRDAIGRDGYDAVQTMFGGSVMKGTYVTGLSDVDALLIVNDSNLVSRPPKDTIELVRGAIKNHFPDNEVCAGNLAVTVEYADGPEIQILPAVRNSTDGVRIAEPGGSKWSNITRPEAFADKLAKVNTDNDGRVVPVIKLVKVIADRHVKRKNSKLSGYHIESLAVDAFDDYDDELNPKSMLVHFLTYSMDAVMTPIVDSTGQSRYVDEHLCTAGSPLRERARTYFGQMRANVNHCSTRKDFNALFGR